MHTIIAANQGTLMKTRKFQALPRVLTLFGIYRQLVSMKL